MVRCRHVQVSIEITSSSVGSLSRMGPVGDEIRLFGGLFVNERQNKWNEIVSSFEPSEFKDKNTNKQWMNEKKAKK